MEIVSLEQMDFLFKDIVSSMKEKKLKTVMDSCLCKSRTNAFCISDGWEATRTAIQGFYALPDLPFFQQLGRHQRLHPCLHCQKCDFFTIQHTSAKLSWRHGTSFLFNTLPRQVQHHSQHLWFLFQ